MGGKFAFRNRLGLLLEGNLCRQFFNVQMINGGLNRNS